MVWSVLKTSSGAERPADEHASMALREAGQYSAALTKAIAGAVFADGKDDDDR